MAIKLHERTDLGDGVHARDLGVGVLVDIDGQFQYVPGARVCEIGGVVKLAMPDRQTLRENGGDIQPGEVIEAV